MKPIKTIGLTLLSVLIYLFTSHTATGQPCSFVPAFTADSAICLGSTVSYKATKHSGNTYAWSITKGSILSGGNSDIVVVLWHTSGSGSIKLVESSGTCKDSLIKAIRIIPAYNKLSVGNYSLVGNASQSSGVVTLTTTSNNLTSAAWYPKTISLDYSFDFNFKVYLCGSADGMMFVLQNNGTSSIGAGGGSMGYFGASGTVFDKSLGIELDIYTNGATQWDSSASHIALVKNKNFKTLRPQVQISSPTIGAQCSYVKFRVVWNSVLKELELWYNGNKIFTHSSDLKNTIFGGNAYIYFGFTGATGGLNATQSFTTDSLLIGTKPANVVADINKPDHICSGDTITYNIKPPKGLTNTDYGTKWKIRTYSLKTASGTASSNTSIIYPSSSGAGKFIFYPKQADEDSLYLLGFAIESTTFGGCDSIYEKFIQVYSRPASKFSVSKDTVCKNSILTFTNTAANGKYAKYRWYMGNGDTSSKLSFTYFYAKSGIYTVSLVAYTPVCKDSTSKQITIMPLMGGSRAVKGTPFKGLFRGGDISSPDMTCTGDTIVYEITPPNGMTNGDFGTKWTISSLTFKTPNGTTTTNISTVNPSSSGNGRLIFYPGSANADSTYYANILIKNLATGCDSSYGRYIRAFPSPAASFTINATQACRGTSLTFNSTSTSSPSIKYRWYMGNGDTSNKTTFSYKYKQAGTYTVSLVAYTPACRDSVTKQVNILEPPTGFEITKGTPFTGYFNNGTSGNPDLVCLKDTLRYLLTPPSNFPNSDHGKTWKVDSVYLIATNGYVTTNYTVNKPISTTDGNVTFIPLSSDKDKTFILTYKLSSSSLCKDTVLTHYIQINPSPLANFGFVNACEGSPVSFTDSSVIPPGMGGFTVRKYEFGDGGFSTQRNSSHTYTAPGTYTVTFTVTTKGCLDKIIKQVTIYEKPKPDFSSAVACEGNNTIFNDASTSKDGKINGYWWEFEPGITSIQKSPFYKFLKAGTYTVRHAVITEFGCTDTVVKAVTVQTKPKADFTKPFACLGQQIKFDNKSTDSSGSLTYIWRFGDGSTSTQVTPAHIYQFAGTYNVTLVAISSSGCRDSITQQVELYPQPKADFTLKGTCATLPVSFASTSVIGSGGAIINWQWNFGDGSTGTGPTSAHVYTSPGIYNIRLTVVSDKGCKDSIEKQIILAAKPVANFTVPDPICQGGLATFSNTSTSGGGTVIYTWSFGDGDTSNITSPSHTFDSAGTYQVKLKMETSSGCKSEVTKSFIVNANPRPSFTYSVSGKKVTFTPNTTDYITYVWDFGDNSPKSTEKSPIHTYPVFTGSFLVKLNVADANGCVGIYQDTVKLGIKSISENTSGNILQVYPNPFHSAVRITYALSKPANVKVFVSDAQGKEIAVLANENQMQGNQELMFKASDFNLSAGIYYVNLIVDGTPHTSELIYSK